jgi:DNA primase catalytic core
MSENKELISEIYRKLDRLKLLHDLDPHELDDYYILECPHCEKREAFIYKAGTKIVCNRKNHCGFESSLWDFLQKKYQLTAKETLQKLALAADVVLPTFSHIENERVQRELERFEFLEKAMGYFCSQLWTQEGQEALHYLHSRGYSDSEIQQMGLGFFPSSRAVKDYFVNIGYNVNNVNIYLKWLDYRDNYVIVLPQRDLFGRVIEIWGRVIPSTEGKEKNKYKPFTEASKSTPFNLNAIKSHKEIIIVEGYFDALIATARGKAGVLAIGGTKLTKEQLHQLQSLRIKQCILVLDNDAAGRKGTFDSLLECSKLGIQAFVCEIPSPYKDPDELIIKEGIETFENLTKNACSAGDWACRYLSKIYDLNVPLKLNAARKEALRIATFFTDPIDNAAFSVKAAELFKIAPDLFKSNSLPTKEVQEETQSLGVYTLKDLQKDLVETQESLKTGFPKFDTALRIPQEAITIIAGRPSHGKTTFMLNLFLKMAETYPQKEFYFFSYEETKKQLALKLLNMLIGQVFDPSKNLRNIEGYIKGNLTENREIEKGKKLFEALTQSKRLRLIDEPLYVDDLAETIRQIKQKGEVGAIFIDYIQKVKIKGKFGTRQLELQKVSETLLETAKSQSVPIILGAQLGRDSGSSNKVRLDNLREAGDIEQDANLVLGIYNEAMERLQFDESIPIEQKVDLKVVVLKNRNGAVNRTLTFEFERPTLKITEK